MGANRLTGRAALCLHTQAMHRVLPCLFLLSAGTLTAQRVWVVDQFGTGDFRDIPPAVAAAAPGDQIIVVGVGPYSLDATINKSLAIIAWPSRFAHGHLRIVDLAPHDAVTVTGFGLMAGDRATVEIDNCRGLVVLSQLSLDGQATAQTPARAGLSVRASSGVFVDGVQSIGAPGCLARDATLATSLTSFRGSNRVAGLSLQGLDAERCQLHLYGSAVGGQGAQTAAEGAHGLWLRDCTAVLAGGADAGSAQSPLVAMALLAERSQVWLNDTVGVTFTGQVSTPSSSLVRVTRPQLTLGGTHSSNPMGFGCYVMATPGNLVAIVAGLPTTPFATPWGRLWLQATPTLVVAVATASALGELRADLLLPQLPAGMTFMCQAVELQAGDELVLSNPFAPIVWW